MKLAWDIMNLWAHGDSSACGVEHVLKELVGLDGTITGLDGTITGLGGTIIGLLATRIIGLLATRIIGLLGTIIGLLAIGLMDGIICGIIWFCCPLAIIWGVLPCGMKTIICGVPGTDLGVASNKFEGTKCEAEF